MSIAKSPTESSSVSPAPQDQIQTRADNELPFNTEAIPFATKWQSLVDDTLIDWGLLSDRPWGDEITPPSREVVSKAAKLAQKMKDLPSPDRVVPDGDGGIVFEHRSNAGVEVMHVWDDGSVEYYRLTDGRVVERHSMDV
jgi:hypothetical protein